MCASNVPTLLNLMPECMFLNALQVRVVVVVDYVCTEICH